MIGLFDVILAAALVLIAWTLLSTDQLLKAVVLFVVFGLLAALAYARLQAPDVALTEAAVGAGVTGVLLLDALRRLQDPPRTRRKDDGETAT